MQKIIDDNERAQKLLEMDKKLAEEKARIEEEERLAAEE